jgi:integrase
MAKIRKRGSTWQIDYTDPTRARIRKSFKKRKEAEAELGKRVSLIAEKRYLDVKREYTTTLGQLLAKYEENHGRQACFQNWKRFCLKNFREAFGEATLLANIRYVDLETYRNRTVRKATKNGTLRAVASVNREISCLHHIFRKAVEWDMVERSPFDRGRTLLIKENNKRLRYLTDEEIPRLLAACPKHLGWLVVCALNTGMRKGEILGLTWDQIRGGFIYLQKTKTNESRQIPVNEDLARLFGEIRKVQPVGSAHVFTYWNGMAKQKGPEPVRKRREFAPVPEAFDSVKTSFKSACKRAGVQDFKFHDLRL